MSIFSFSKYGPHPAYLVIWLIMNTEYLPNYAHGSPDLSLCVALLCYELACPAGLEPATYGLEDRCSNPTELRADMYELVPPAGLEPARHISEGF